MTVTPSTLVATESGTTDKNQLWQPPVFFIHDWGKAGCRVETTWRTMVTSARSNAEQRFALMDKPRRRVDARGLGWNMRERGQQLMRNQLTRLGDARMPFPLYPDRVKVTAKGAAYPNVYVVEEPLDTRRFFIGARVLGCNIENAHPQWVDDYLIRKITAINPSANEITLDGDLGETYTGLIVERDWVWSTGTHASAYETVGTIANLSSYSNPVIVVYALVDGWYGDVTSINSVSWEPITGSEGMTAIFSESIQDPGSSLKRHGVWYLRPSAQDVSGKIKVTYTTSKTATVAVAGFLITGVKSTGNPWQGSGSDEDIHYNLGFPPMLLDCSVARATDNVTDWLILCHTVTQGAAQTQLSATLPSSGWVNFRSAGLRYTSCAVWTRSDNSDVSDNPLTCQAKWQWVTMPLPGDRGEAMAVSFAAEQDILDIPAKRYVYPLFEANLSLAHEHKATHADLAEYDLTAVETAGPSALDPLRTPNTLNPAWPTHTQDTGLTFPIFDFFPDWNDTTIRFVRPGRQNVIGTGLAFDVYGNRPLAEIEASFTGLHREDVWDLMEFFDSRAGRCFPFWYVNPTADYEFISNNGSTTLKVTSAGAEYDWNFYPFVAVVMKDGTYYIRRVTGVTRAAGEDSLTLDVAISTVLDADDIKKVSAAFLCRFADDTFEEKWATDEIQEVTLRIFELDYDLETTDKSVSLDVICPGGDGSGGWVPDGDDICDLRCCGTACNACLDYPIEFTCWCYAHGTGADCSDPCSSPATQSVSLTITFTPDSCVSGVAKWVSNDAWVELDLDGPDWTWYLGSYNCCAGLIIYTSCLCASIWTFCSPSEEITETCTYYQRKIVTDEDCTLLAVTEITCPGCASGAC